MSAAEMTLPPEGPAEKAAREAKVKAAVFEHKTDTGNAKRLAAMYEGKILYCPAWRSWLIWNGKFWERDQSLRIDQFAKQTIEQMHVEAREHPDEEERRKRTGWCLSSESTARLRAMVENARSELAIEPTELDADPYVLNVENGTINLHNGLLRKHDPDDLITLMAPVCYSPDAKDVRWEEVLDRFVRPDEGKEQFLQRAAFASLTGTTSDKAFMNLYDDNDGNTGKTTFLESLKLTLGPYAAAVSAEAFLLKTTGHAGIRADLAVLAGKRLVVSSEVPSNRKLDTALIKKLTSGSGTHQFELKYGNPWEGDVTFTIWLDGNSVAKANAEDNPLFNRWRLTPFKHRIAGKPDPRWLERAGGSPEYRAAVLAWAMRGRKPWQARGIGTALSIESATAEVRAEMDPLREFWDECCEFGEHTRADPCSVTSADLFRQYVVWCRASSVHAINKRDFQALLRGRGVTALTVKVDGVAQSGWRGVRLKRSWRVVDAK